MRTLTLLSIAFLLGCQPQTAPPEQPPAQPDTAVAKTPPPGPDTASPPEPKGEETPPPVSGPAIELVESWPVETTLDHPELRDAPEVWLELIEGAKTSLDFEEFYAVEDPGTKDRLDPIIAAIEAAARRGVKVRFVVDKKFYTRNNWSVPDRLAAHDNIELRIIDFDKATGGVQHAKLFVVDGAAAYVGSQNFDWRSLTHVQELGAVVREPNTVKTLSQLFELDWAIAGGAEPSAALAEMKQELASAYPVTLLFEDGEVKLTTVLSPTGLIPDEKLWDLPKILALIDGAKTRVRVQIMTYATVNYDKTTFTRLDDALHAAADRGVSVELIVADWSLASKSLPALKALQAKEKITVKIITIPPASTGFVPYARVVHAKYMTVDGEHAWLGTSNWSGDYFTQSRNAGFIVEGKGFTARLDAFFDTLWSSDYATVLDPAREDYERPPRSAPPQDQQDPIAGRWTGELGGKNVTVYINYDGTLNLKRDRDVVETCLARGGADVAKKHLESQRWKTTESGYSLTLSQLHIPDSGACTLTSNATLDATLEEDTLTLSGGSLALLVGPGVETVVLSR